MPSLTTPGPMVGISRYRNTNQDPDQFHAALTRALAAFASCPGYETGHIGHNTDDPTLWVMTVHFDSLASYRRALSSFRVKTDAVPVMYQAVDEPTAFETRTVHDPAGVTDYESMMDHGGTRTPDRS